MNSARRKAVSYDYLRGFGDGAYVPGDRLALVAIMAVAAACGFSAGVITSAVFGW